MFRARQGAINHTPTKTEGARRLPAVRALVTCYLLLASSVPRWLEEVEETPARAASQSRDARRRQRVQHEALSRRRAATGRAARRCQTRLALYDRVDVIVSYTTALGAARTWLPYIPDVPEPNSWSVASIANDSFEPGLLNPGETAQLLIELAPAAAPGGTHRIVIASETGAVASAPFSS